MPKNPLKFSRRKSSGTAFEDVVEPSPPAATSSFRVLERPDKINLDGPYQSSPDRLRQPNRPSNSPLANVRGKSAEELGVGLNRLVERPAPGGDWLLNRDRGSGGTTNSGSSGYYESSSASARHSSSSTLPSSVDAEKEPDEDELFPRRTKTAPMYQTLTPNANDPPPPPPSFTSRAARALSFGQKYKNGTNSVVPPPPPPMGAVRSLETSKSPRRERATTTSSYASTAKPEVNLNISSSDFGADFGSMFEAPRNDRYDTPLPPVPPVAAFHRAVRGWHEHQENQDANKLQESEPMFPPRTHSRNAFQSMSEDPKLGRDDAGSPYGWDHRNSRDGLMSNSPMSSPRMEEDAPPVPPHNSVMAKAFLGKPKDGYARVPERYPSPGNDRLSPDGSTGFFGEFKEKDDSYDRKQNKLEDDRWVKRVELQDARTSNSNGSFSSESASGVARLPTGFPASTQATAGASRFGAMSPGSSEDGGSLWESTNTTPRAAKLEIARNHDDSLFDSSPLGPASRAIRPQHSRMESDTPKRMTKAQFDRLQRGGGSSNEQSEDEEQLDEYDDEDDAEKAKQMAQQRRKQEANMSVYRQQMKKVTGGGPADLPSMARPSLDRAAASAPAAGMASLHLGGMSGQPPPDAPRGKPMEDEDDDVPLGILQAHGFPTSARPPTRQGEGDAVSQRRGSVAGSVAGGNGGQGNLPVFARRLPQDPYYGAGLVNQTNRESLGFGGTPSVYGGGQGMQPIMMQQQQQQQSQGHPGGLVGVIAGEERAKAARRGSPNMATGAFSNQQMNLPTNMPGQVPGMPPRTISMGSVQPPQVYTPSGMGANEPMMPGMSTMPQMMQQMMQQPQQQQSDQMQQFMQMQMQFMQSMMAMQQQNQMGSSPQPQQQMPDYLGAGLNASRQSSMARPAPSVHGQPTNQGRAMTMMYPPTRWDIPPGGQRPNSAMPSTYSPSGTNLTPGGPDTGYTPSIAPSERSNVGMPSRYRPVTVGGDGTGRTQSMTSSLTLQAYGNGHPSVSETQPPPRNLPESKSTIKLIDKPKGAPRVTSKPVFVDEDDDEGWADMRQKREEKKKFRFGRKEKEVPPLGEYYHGYD